MPALMRFAHLLVATGLLLAACQPAATSMPPTPVTVIATSTPPTPEPTASASEPSVTPTVVPTPSTYPRLVRAPRSNSSVTTRWPLTRLEFTRPMDPASVAAALTVSPAVTLNMRWDANTLVVVPAEPLALGTTYGFTLTQIAVDTHGLALAETYRWHYHLSELVAAVSYPTHAHRDRKLSLRFNYALSAASLHAAFRLDPPVDGALSVTDNGRRLTFTPAVSLTMNTRYTVTFASPLVDVDGLAVPLPVPFSFTTPSPILEASPGAQNNIAPTAPVRLTFDRLMDQASTEAAVTIQPAVPGRFEWDAATLRFIPDGYLAEDTRYTVTVAGGLRAADGSVIDTRPVQWSFTTGKLRAIASFGPGPKTQVLDAAGRRAVQFVYFQETSAPLSFDLHALTTEQFLERYAASLVTDPYSEAPDIDTAGLSLVRAWQLNNPTVHRNDYGNPIGEVVVPADVPPGLYVLNLRTGPLNDQLLLAVSHHVAALKQAEGQLVAWVSSPGGLPVPGAQVSVYGKDGALLAQGQADARGVYRLDVAPDLQPHFVITANGDDRSVAGLSAAWENGNYGWYGWWQPERLPAPDRYAAHVYTDRPIYRPGQTVSFKAILRRDEDAALSVLAAGTVVTVRVRDARSNVVQTFALETGDYGTVHGQFALAEGAMLGEYAVEVAYDGESHRQAFKVQDYRKPDYEVTVRADAAEYVAGDRVRVTVDTRYFFGEPVPFAHLELRQYEIGTYYDCWEGCTSSGSNRWHATGERELRVQADAAGRYTFDLTARTSHLAQYGWSVPEVTHWGFEVTADDGSHQTVTGFATAAVYAAAEQLALDTAGYVQTPGQPFALTALARTNAGAPVDGRAVRLQLRRWTNSTYDYTDIVHTLDLVTGADGKAAASLTVSEPGYYEARLTGRDGRGNALETRRWLYVFAEGDAWSGQTNRTLSVSADRGSYAPGDTATLLVESAFSGPALLTFERGHTRREQLVTLTAPLTRLPVLVEPGDAPNIFVTVNLWEPLDTSLKAQAGNSYLYLSLPDAQLRQASVNLNVPMVDKQLTITLTPSQPVYAPGEQARFTVRVTNARGEPVAAEVSLALVDEAIFSLSETLSGPIFNAFYDQRANRVRTFDSLAPRRYLMDEGGRGGGGGDDFGAGSPRRDFADTAAWFPALQTNWNGEAVVTFTLPDNLTTWRLTAKAVTADTQVGEAETTILTRQDISVRPLLPRSLTAGDEVLLSAMVRNDSDAAHTLQVVVDAAGLRLAVPATQTLTLAPGQQRLVGWPAVASAAGAGRVTVRAEAIDQAGLGDAIELPLPIQPLAIPTVTTEVGDFTREFATTLDRPAQALPMSTVRLELSRSIAGTLLTGLEYLTGFPYGCVEQTMSRALPNAVVGRALHQLGVSHPTLEAELPPMIHASIQRLYGFQHNDGGWGWWHDDNSDAYQTAWVVFGLATTAQAGYEVDAGVIRRGVDWLSGELDRLDPRTRAFALYSLAVAGYGDLTESLALAREASRLDAFSQAGLALALHRLGAHAHARQLLDTLAASAVTQDGRVYWTNAADDGHYDHKTMASATRSTALALSAFVAIRPGHALEPGIVRFLMGQRRDRGWGTTNETSFAILGLTDHLLARKNEPAASAYRVEVNGQVVFSGTLDHATPAVSLEVPFSALRNGANTLRVTQPGGGRLYYVVSSRVYVPEAALQAAGGLTVTRQYLNPKTNQPLTGTVAAGQLVEVRVTVNYPNDAFYVLVEDHLPGGLEALNEGLNTTSHEATAYAWDEPHFYWQTYGYNNKEVFGDRVSFFITQVDQGRHVYTYFARAVRAGSFVALPAEASAMYDLTVWGRSASAEMVIGE